MIIGYRKTNTETNQVEDIIYYEAQTNRDFVLTLTDFFEEVPQLSIIDYFIAERTSPTEYNKLGIFDKTTNRIVSIIDQMQSGA